MALIKTKGLVVKEIAINDTDKMLTIITSDLGMISVCAKNSRKGGSRCAYGTQVLTFGEYVIFSARGTNSLNGCDIITSYYDIASDLIRFTHAAHMLELAGDVVRDSLLAAQVLNTLLYGLEALKKGRNPLLVSSAFSLKLMQLSGYPPHTTSCVLCKTKDIEDIYFSFENCGFLCELCAKQHTSAIPVEFGVAKAILYVLCAQKSGIFNFELSESVLTIFSKITLRYTEERLDKNYKKLDFLNEI